MNAKSIPKRTGHHLRLAAGLTVLTLAITTVRGAGLQDGLVSYWPLDTVVGGKTPDLVSGYDLAPYIGGAHTLGKHGRRLIIVVRRVDLAPMDRVAR